LAAKAQAPNIVLTLLHEGPIYGAQFSADDQWILTWSYDGTARLWSATDGTAAGQPMKHEYSVSGAQSSSDGQRIPTRSEGGMAQLWNTANSQCIVLFWHTDEINAALFNREETRVVTATEDGTARLWDISPDDRIPPDEHILEFEVRSAATLGNDGEVRVLTSREWQDHREKLLQMEIKSRLALTPSGTVRTLNQEDVVAKQLQLKKIKGGSHLWI
jgi:WD40 repeat protein